MVLRPGVALLFGVCGLCEDIGRLRSGVLEGVRRSLELWLLGARNDFVFCVLRDLVSSLLPSFFRLISRNDRPDLLSALNFLLPALGLLFTVMVGSWASGGTNVPGSIDFLGAFAGLLWNEFGGN